MANDISAVVPLILGGGMVALRENCVAPSLINSDYSALAQQKGSSVDVPIPSDMGPAKEMNPSVGSSQATAIKPTKATIKLDRWMYQDFTLTDTEVGKMMNGFLPLQITEAAKSIANTIDRDILGLYKYAYGAAGVAGQTPFQSDNAIPNPAVYQGLGASRDARAILNRQLCPVGDRRIILDVDAEANASALPQFANAQYSGDANVITNGVIGTKQGFDWYMDQNVLYHIRGAAGSYSTSAAATKGATVLSVTGGTAPPVFGDLFTIAGHTQTYTILEGSTLTTLNISPALRVDVPSSRALTFVNSHVANLAFHRNAFAFAMRSLDDVIAPGSIIETYTDDLTGLVMRLEIMRQNGQTTFRFDVLYGLGCPRPELVARMLG